MRCLSILRTLPIALFSAIISPMGAQSLADSIAPLAGEGNVAGADAPLSPPGTSGQTHFPACGSGAVPIMLTGDEKRCITPGSGSSFKDCPDCPELVVAPAGSFTMGSSEAEIEALNAQSGTKLHPFNKEGPQHKVTISKPFAAGKFSVTFDEWDACVADGGCGRYSPPDQGWGRGRRPVINVNWDDAKAYVAWLSRKTGKEYRLLSEAEREYVSRAGTTEPFWWGASISTGQANYNGSPYRGGSKGLYRRQTVPVDSFKPNPWGLYQVHGNVWEWVEDRWNYDYRGAPQDGSARTTGESGAYVLRGGSWVNEPQYLRAASRSGFGMSVDRIDVIGFRVARTLVSP